MTASDSEHQTLQLPGGGRLVYQSQSGRGPGLVFCPGFQSDMGGTKAEALADWCRRNDRAYTRFDYRGHGLSGGDFADCTIGMWRDDVLAILDQVAGGPQVLVGSSMGGWLALLAALARPQRVAGLLLIAPAPDFTERLYRERLDGDQLRALERQGYCEMVSAYDPEPYIITRKLVEEARSHQLLGAGIAIDVPVRVIHGQRDDAVPWQLSLDLLDRLRATDVELQLVKAGDHRLSEPADLRRLSRTLEALFEESIKA
ncbi:alpha/beta hydrolase [Parahaliea mediterranea]|uniref:Alpha/beta hydrolase n=1 Tax=Parahaliea mediterranea TaxID=651086 RepID=A0A939DD06_9GAMM|nr:alpha/beta hydrolase [Parahaliea mediterranea]MBN7795980.1 alpha/beta hydrolase [Parahaliea mediterranea]